MCIKLSLSVNLANLPDKERVLGRLASFLDSLTEPITFHILQDEREIEGIGALYQIPYKRFFVETSFAGITGCKVHRFGGDKGSGLDPFAIFPSKRVAADFFASVAKVENDQDLLADLYLTAEKASNVNELIELATGYPCAVIRLRFGHLWRLVLRSSVTPFIFLCVWAYISTVKKALSSLSRQNA